MSFFAVELVDLIESRFDGNQQRFSKATGIDPSMVSRQCSGRSLPDSATIRKAISGISPADAANLVAAYLRDVCPSGVRDLIQIRALAESDDRVRNSIDRSLLDLSSLKARDQEVARSVVKWLQLDPAASEFLNHALGLVARAPLKDRP
jgi:hypothetical protein